MKLKNNFFKNFFSPKRLVFQHEGPSSEPVEEAVKAEGDTKEQLAFLEKEIDQEKIMLEDLKKLDGRKYGNLEIKMDESDGFTAFSILKDGEPFAGVHMYTVEATSFYAYGETTESGGSDGSLDMYFNSIAGLEHHLKIRGGASEEEEKNS